MPTIKKETLDAMMNEVPPEQRDAFLMDFKNRGYTIAPTDNTPSGYLMKLADYVKNPEGPIDPVLSAYRDIYHNIADPIKQVGNFSRQGNVMLGQILQQGLGNPMNPNPMPGPVRALGSAYQTASKYLNPIPNTDLGIALSPLMANQVMGAFQREANAIPVGSQALNKPSFGQSVAAAALSAANRLKPDKIGAVIANPEILSDATPTTNEVSQMYKNALEEAGVKIDDARYQFVTGMTRAPRDSQVGKLEDIVDQALEKLKPGSKVTLTDSEAFIAQQAANQLKRSTQAAMNPNYAGDVSKQADQLTSVLENSSLPNIRQLNRLWFMAKTKEEVGNVLPLNKAGTPNALSTLLMANQFKQAIGQASQGSLGKAAGSTISGMAFSPYMFGQGMGAYQSAQNNAGALGQIGINASQSQ